MINDNTICHHDHPLLKRVSWSAVFVGALVGVGLGFLLNLFTMALGISLFTQNQTGATMLAVGGLLAIIIATIAAMVVSGYTAGYLGRHYAPRRNLGILYGFTTWTLALILGAFTAGHIAQYASNYSVNVSQSHSATQAGKANTLTVNKPAKNNALNNGVAPNNTTTAPSINLTATGLATEAFLVFVLFFIGAISTCVGACWGMSCRRED